MNSKQFAKAALSSARPEMRLKMKEAFKKAGINAKVGSRTQIGKIIKVTKDLQKAHYFKGQIEGAGTYGLTPKHLVSELAEVAQGADKAGDEKRQSAIAARAEAVENRENIMEGRIAARETKVAEHREEMRERNISRVRTERTAEATREDVSGAAATDADKAKPAFGHLAPIAAKPGQPPSFNNPDKKAVDMFGGE